jgi:hypothetical protein
MFAAGCASQQPAMHKMDKDMAPSGEQVKCGGVNECKGQGQCGGANHGCAGNNECKGQGWVSLSSADCTAKGGNVIN